MNNFGDNELEIADLFSRSIFEIPRYQREYSWNQKQVEDLLDDIEFIHGRKESGVDVEHYFGTIVLEDRGEVEVKTGTFKKYAVVDGQQRITTHTIFVQCVLEEIEEIEELANEDLDQGTGDWRTKYIHSQGEDRLTLGSISQDRYKELVINERSPSEVSDKVEHSAGNKLVDAKRHISNRTSEWRADYLSDGTRSLQELEKYRDYLNSILKVATSDLKVTVKSIDDMDEAARMFKVINNRGKELTTFDKVKSHIVYAAERCGLDAEEKYREFGEITRNVTSYDDCGDDMLDDLIQHHWTVFARESSSSGAIYDLSGPNEIDKRIAQMKEYAEVDSDNLEKFIDEYINTLKTVSEFYPYLRKPELYVENHDLGSTSDLRKLQALGIHKASSKHYTPTLIATAYNYGIESKELGRVINALEVLYVRYNIVRSQGTDPFRGEFFKDANSLFWANTPDHEVKKIFNTNSDRYLGAESKRAGLETIVEECRSRVDSLIPDGEFEEYLIKKDVIEGDFSSGYGGMRSEEGILYIMHQYEKYLRSGSDTELNGLNSFVEFREDFQLEHLVPRNAESGHKLSPHDKNRNRLGNLSFLGETDNKKWGNRPYTDKYDGVYKDSSYRVLNQLPSPEMTTKKVQDRGLEIASFAVKRWSIGG
jgi:hypothetical protein